MMKCDWISAPGENCPKKHPERPVALLSARRASDDYMPWGSAPFWGPPSEESRHEERQSTEQDEGSAAAATPVAFRAKKDPKPANVDHGTVAGCFDAFLFLICSLLSLYFLGYIDYSSFLGTTPAPAVTATAYLSHVSVAAVPWYFRGANDAVGWILWIVRVLRSDVSIWMTRTLVLLVGSTIISWFVVKTAIFLVHLAVAVFLELASAVATGACVIRNIVVSWCVFISRWDSVSAVMLKLGLRKPRPNLHFNKPSRSGSQFVSKKSRRVAALATQATMFPDLYVPVTIPDCFAHDGKLWARIVGAKICDGQCYSLLDMSLPVAPSSHWFERALHRGGWRSTLLCPWHVIWSVSFWGHQFFQGGYWYCRKQCCSHVSNVVDRCPTGSFFSYAWFKVCLYSWSPWYFVECAGCCAR
jgi:hypothetical protein